MSSVAMLALLVVFMATMAVAIPVRKGESDTQKPESIIEGGKFSDEMEVEAVVQRRIRDSTRTTYKSCNSTKTNDSYAAAYIVGAGSLWNKNDPIEDFLYETHWFCNKSGSGAFVDGGMRFDQADKKLYVPECGYYYVSSQVYFGWQSTSTPSQAKVHHQLLVKPNCGSEFLIASDVFAVNGTSEWMATTFTGKVFKMCTGGSVHVRIPVGNGNGNACCAYGNSHEHSTFISAHLVHPSNCQNFD